MTNSFTASDAAHQYVLQEVRRADRDRFLAALFAPEPQRRGLLALLAFDHELARTRTVTREPMLARIRLQWWRDAVEDAVGDATPRAQPVVESLSETVRQHDLPSQRLNDLIDAHEEEVDGALDVVRAGTALADLQLKVLGVQDDTTRRAAHAIATASLMGEGAERDALVSEARALRARVDPAALPILLPAVSLDGGSAGLRPLAYWWAARRGRY
jgi:phytoene/squalene synthetase